MEAAADKAAEREEVVVAEVLQAHRKEMAALLNDWMSKLEYALVMSNLPSGARSPISRGASKSTRFGIKPSKSSTRGPRFEDETLTDDQQSAVESDLKAPTVTEQDQFKASPTTASDTSEEDDVVEGHGIRAPRRLDSTLSYEEAKMTDVEIARAWNIGASAGLAKASSIPLGWWHPFRERVESVMSSQWSTAFWTLAIITNSLYLGIHLQWSSDHREFRSHRYFDAVHLGYAVLFTLEVLLRVIAVGCWSYIVEKDWKWNWLDLFVVVSSWVEIVADRLASEGADDMLGANTNLRIIRVLRLGRLVRVVRIVRVVRLFRALRTLVASLMGTLKSLFWSFLLLFLVIYIFAILFTDVALDYAIENNSSDEDLMQVHFGNLYISMNTLFRSISNGIGWAQAADAFAPAGEFWVQCFQLYVAFCLLALLNVMTGVFCNSAIKAAESDHDLAVQSLVQTRKEMAEQVEKLFRTIDERGSGQVTISEFERNFDKDAVKAFFEVLKIGAVDAWTLFSSLDKDGDHTVNVEEFTERCLQLHGPARAADLFAMKQQTAKLARQLRDIQDLQGRLSFQMARLTYQQVLPPEEARYSPTAETVTFKF
ncbi:Scn11a [Symbiodinium sp. CCMP2456]|nr:Scn11a [Symbiodinium sp. CCMP2456]